MEKTECNLLENKSKNLNLRFFLAVCILVVLPLGWLVLGKLEGEDPSVEFDLPFPAIGASPNLPLTVSDNKSGLRNLWVGLIKNDKEFVFFEKNFPPAGIFGTGRINKESFNISANLKEKGINDGKAVLRIVARDYSWRRWWNGNRTLIEKEVTVDNRPPSVDVMSKIHNIIQGGAGFVIYRVSEPCSKSGVYVGENFFPGYSARNIITSKYNKEAEVFIAFIALDYRQGGETDIFVQASDYAGNIRKEGFRYFIRKKTFKKDVLNISDKFLDWELSEFNVNVPQDTSAPQVEKFLAINRDLREANYRQLIGITKNTDQTLYWDGAFLRLPKSAGRAGFADHREYRYEGRTIDHQVHLGVDLASLAHSPVPAGNRGRVAFVGDIGIYGHTVMIDHGFGLFSTYSHLSDSEVKDGQIVSKGDIIGHTGTTGLAVGDHLHFGMIVGGIFVNPIEWWDKAWIKNNISNKIKDAKAELN